MAVNLLEIQKLYIALFNRAGEKDGLVNWAEKSYADDLGKVADEMLKLDIVKDYFGPKFNDEVKFVEQIYINLLGKALVADEAKGLREDKAGIELWAAKVTSGETSRGEMVNQLLKTIQSPEAKKADPAAAALFEAKLDVAMHYSNSVATGNDAIADNFAFSKKILAETKTDNIEAQKAAVDAKYPQENGTHVESDWNFPEEPSNAVELTVETDNVTANYIKANMKYTPGGDDFISTLQDEDVIKGVDGRTDNTLSAVIGDANDENGGVITPQLDNIQNLKLQMTGNLGSVNLRYADGLEKLNVVRVHENAFKKKDADDKIGNAEVTGIKNDVDLRLADVDKLDDNGNFIFDFREGVLSGLKDEGKLYLYDVRLNEVSARNSSANEGYETLNLVANNGVRLNTLSLSELETLKVFGNDKLQILEVAKPTSYTTKVVGTTTPKVIETTQLTGQFVKYDGGIENTGNAGIEKIDLSGFAGSSTTLGISSAVSNKGFSYIGSDANDKLYVLAGTNINSSSELDGGTGDNTIVLVDTAPEEGAKVKNFTLADVKLQDLIDKPLKVDASQFVGLKEVTVRNENPGLSSTPTFEINNIKADQIVNIEHSVDTMINKNLTINNVKSASVDSIDLEVKTIAAKDVDTANFVVRESKDFKDTQDGFNYKITANNSADKAIANVVIDDQDRENNYVEFVGQNKGTITLKGGEADDKYTVRSDLNAKTVDASAQKSDLYLSIKNQMVDGKAIDQEVKLGLGNDTAVFSEVNALDNVALSDAGGKDTVKAYFNKNTDLDIKGIETLQTLATKSIDLDLAKVRDFETLVLLSDKAGQVMADDKAEDGFENPFNLGNEKVETSDIITLKNSYIKELNFFGDLNKLDLKEDGTLKLDVGAHFDKEQTFNGVNINASKAEELKVNINSSLDVTRYIDDAGKVVDVAADKYDIGHIAAKNVKTMNIVVDDDDAETSTNINGIFSDALTTLTAKTEGNLKVGAITNTSAAKPTLKTVDFTNVGGKTTATINILADDAKVTTGNGGSSLFTEGSNGKDIKFSLGTGDDNVVSGGNNETFEDLGGNNYIRAGVGNNTIDMLDLKAGNDIILTGYGKDTVTVGGGFDRVIDGFNSDKKVEDTENTIINNSGVVRVLIDSKSQIGGKSNEIGNYQKTIDELDGIIVGKDIVDQYFASVSETLSINYKGDQLSASSTLDGRLANGVVVDESTAALKIKDDDKANLINTTDGNDFVLVGVEKIENGYFTFADDAANTAVKASKGDDVIIATKAQTTALDIKGGEGNDAIVVYATAAHKIQGGVGADTIVIGKGDETVELTIDTKDSIVGAHDTIYNLSGVSVSLKGLGTPPASMVANTDIKLSDIKKVGSDAVKAELSGGLVKLKNTDNTDFFINKGNLKDAISALKGAMTDAAKDKSFMFKYDANNDGKYGSDDSIFVFINNSDQTLVEFAGVDASTTDDIAAIATFA